MKRLFALVAALIPASGLESEAEACGGCFAPPGAFTAVDSHRMVIALGVEETVLWDQFIYSGAPEECAWVLPVPSSGAVVEVAAGAFGAGFDAGTAPIIQAPEGCGQSAGGCGRGDSGFGPGAVEGVGVLRRRTV